MKLWLFFEYFLFFEEFIFEKFSRQAQTISVKTKRRLLCFLISIS